MAGSKTGILRATLRRQRRGPGRRTRYPISLRQDVARHARERLASGERLSRIAESLDLALASLQRWVGSERPGQLRPVRLGEASQPRPAVRTGVLVTPSGFRIEGLDTEQLAALLRSLS